MRLDAALELARLVVLLIVVVEGGHAPAKAHRAVLLNCRARGIYSWPITAGHASPLDDAAAA